MNKRNKYNVLMVSLLVLTVMNSAGAGDVKVVAADFQSLGSNLWSVMVTLKHADTGWDHYTDNWQVVDDEGNLLGNRVLYHPHVEEQPFTRGLDSIKVPEGSTIVYIKAHDKVHGWAQDRLKIDLGKASSGRLRVTAD